jgi:parvulin-like peptidyl-prolyl isomerase
LAAGLAFAAGCTNSGTPEEGGFLIRVGEKELMPAEFKRIFEINKTAYAHNDLRDPELLRDIKLRLLNQLLEEMILVEKAGEMGIRVSDAELDAAVADVLQDYPDGVFEDLLMEAAVSFEDWKERLRVRLVTRKVIQAVVAPGIVITPEDIESYYRANYQDRQDSDVTDEALNATIVRQLKKAKQEAAYVEWMKVQRSQYPVEINTAQWERIMGETG